MWLFLLGLFLVFATFVQSQNLFDLAANTLIFQPISSITTPITIGGVTTSETVATFQTSDYLNQGTVYVGNYAVQIASPPPTYNNLVQEVARLPKAVIPYSWKFCLVPDPSSYNSAVSSSLPVADQGGQAAILQAQYESSVENSPARRRLLTDDSLATTEQALFDVFQGSLTQGQIGALANTALGQQIIAFLANPGAELETLKNSGNAHALSQFVEALADNGLCAVLSDINVKQPGFVGNNWQTLYGLTALCNDMTAQGLQSSIAHFNTSITNNTNWNTWNRGNITALNFQYLALVNYTNAQASAINSTIADLQNALITDVQKLANATANATQYLVNLINQNRAELATQINQAFAYSTGNLSQLANLTAGEIIGLAHVSQAIASTLGNLSLFISNYTTQVENEFIAIYSAQADTNTALWTELTQRTLRRAMSTAYFSITSQIPSIFFPLVCDPGVAPQNGGVLVGANKRLAIDTFTILKATGATLYSTTVTVYLNSENELLNGQVGILPPRMLISRFAQSSCTIPFYDNTQSWRTIQGTAYAPPTSPQGICNGWMEVVQTNCAQANANNSLAFENFLLGPILSVYDSVTNSLGVCSGAITTTHIMLDSIATIQTYMNNNYCSASSTTSQYYGLSSAAMGFAYLVGIPSPSDPVFTYQSFPCNTTAYIQMQSASTVLGQILSIVGQQYSNTTTTANLAVLEQVKYGALPQCGITYEDLLFDGFAGTNTGTTTPQICHRATVNLVHSQTLPVYSIIPDPVQPLTNTVTRLITKIDPTIQTDYDQGLNIGQQVTFTEGVTLVDNSKQLPDGTLLVGDLGQSTLYLYDVPARLVDVTSNVHARENTVCYLCMPPGTTSTYTLPQFLQANGNIYDATKATVGAQLFAIPVTKNSQGYPVCNVGGAVGDAYGLQGTTINSARTCSNSGINTWDNMTASRVAMGPLCFPSSSNPYVSPVKLFNRRLDESTLAGSAPWFVSGSTPYGLGVSFVFENIASVVVLSVASQASSFNIFTNSVNGVVGISLNAGSQVVTTTMRGLFDNRKHSYLFVLSGYSGTSLTYVAIFVDGMLDQFATLTTPITTRTTASWSSGSAGQFPYGTEALYVMPWPMGDPNLVLPSSTIDRLHVCSFAVSENHCSPNIGNEVLAFAVPSNAVVIETVCPTSPLALFRSSLLDAYTSTFASYVFPVAGWSLSFWLHVGPGWQTVTGLSSGPVGLMTLTMGTTTATQINVQAALLPNGQFQLKLIQNSVTLLTAVPGLFFLNSSNLVTTKVTIVYGSNAANELDISFNTIRYAFYTVSAFASPGPGVNYVVSQLSAVSMVRLYPYALTAGSVLSDFQCDANTLQNYINPTGYCRFSSLSETEAATYCRSPALCSGNCETYASVQPAAATFANVGVNMCDDGWKPPLCTTPCAHINNITGACTDNEIDDPTLTGSALQLSPAGVFCSYLKSHNVFLQPPASPSVTGTLTGSPVHFREIVTLPVPSGQMSVEITVSQVCPIITAVGLGNTASLSAANPSSTAIIVKLVWTATANNATCFTPVQEQTILAYQVAYFSIPICGNQTLSVYALTPSLLGSSNSTSVLCQTLNVNNVASLVASIGATSESNIISNAAVVGDAALTQANSFNVGLATAMFSAFQVMGIDTTALYSMANAAAQAYATSNQLASDASAIQALANIRSPSVTLSCTTQACQDSMAAIASAFSNIGWVIPTSAPGLGQQFVVPQGGCVSLTGSCSSSGGGSSAGVAYAPSTATASANAFGAASLYNSIFNNGSTNDKFTALGQLWAVLIVSVLIPFVLGPYLLYQAYLYFLPALSAYLAASKERYAKYSAQRAKSKSTGDEDDDEEEDDEGEEEEEEEEEQTTTTKKTKSSKNKSASMATNFTHSYSTKNHHNFTKTKRLRDLHP